MPAPDPLLTVLSDGAVRLEPFGERHRDPLRMAWSMICSAMNDQIATPSAPRPVIPAELGAGKTTAAKTYCAMLPAKKHPGVLVVVRTIEQAEEFARDINAWGGQARAFHSRVKPRPSPEEIAQAPVLVICHKGYGLAVMVDVLCAVLSGAAYGPHCLSLTSEFDQVADVGHFYAAFRIDAFRPLDEFTRTMDAMIRELRASPKAPGQDRVWIPGEPEFEEEERRRELGIPLAPDVYTLLETIAADRDLGQQFAALAR